MGKTAPDRLKRWFFRGYRLCPRAAGDAANDPLYDAYRERLNILRHLHCADALACPDGRVLSVSGIDRMVEVPNRIHRGCDGVNFGGALVARSSLLRNGLLWYIGTLFPSLGWFRRVIHPTQATLCMFPWWGYR